MKYTIIFLFVTTLILAKPILKASGTTLLPTNSIHINTDYTSDCSTYTDCYNCTISNCQWKNKGCKEISHATDRSKRLTLEDFFTRAAYCTDVLGICASDSELNGKDNSIANDKPIKLYNYTFGF